MLKTTKKDKTSDLITYPFSLNQLRIMLEAQEIEDIQVIKRAPL